MVCRDAMLPVLAKSCIAGTLCEAVFVCCGLLGDPPDLDYNGDLMGAVAFFSHMPGALIASAASPVIPQALRPVATVSVNWLLWTVVFMPVFGLFRNRDPDADQRDVRT